MDNSKSTFYFFYDRILTDNTIYKGKILGPQINGVINVFLIGD